MIKNSAASIAWTQAQTDAASLASLRTSLLNAAAQAKTQAFAAASVGTNLNATLGLEQSLFTQAASVYPQFCAQPTQSKAATAKTSGAATVKIAAEKTWATDMAGMAGGAQLTTSHQLKPQWAQISQLLAPWHNFKELKKWNALEKWTPSRIYTQIICKGPPS